MSETVAYLIDCFVEPALEFADVHVPEAAIPLVRRSDLDASIEGHKAARENFLTMQGTAAKLAARIAKLEAALEFYAWEDNYKGAFVPGGYTEHGTFATAHHVNLVRKDAGAIARAALGAPS